MSRQNDDGGFGSYEPRRGSMVLRHFNPAEIYGNCMLEYSYSECTASCVRGLAYARKQLGSSLGPEVDGFEAELAARSGRSHGAALSSGTAALHLALILTGVGADDEVVVPTLTFAATANAVTYVGAAPVFIDSEFATWNLDPDLLGEFLAARATQGRLPAAVVSVDLYGQCADYDRIVPVCEQYGVPLIVDAAEALGATWGGQPAGSFGVFGTFSFNGNKIITSGGGGMLTGDDGDAIARARNLASQAREPAPHYEHTTIGYNYRLSNVLAAIGRGQLADLDRKVDELARVNMALYESNRLKGDFLSTMSHELRTPLNAIIGFTRLIGRSRDAALPDREREFLGRVEANGLRLLGAKP